MKTLGLKIKALRMSKGWTQEDMAEKLHVSLPAYSKLEREITDINLSRINQIAKLFKLSVVELFSYGEEQANDSNLKKQLAEKDRLIMELQNKIIRLMEKQK
jgi:transcriptional regulator with XRE-family HTH domain